MIKYPYVLSVKPTLLASGASAKISFSYLQGQMNIKNATTISVISPSGTIFPYKAGEIKGNFTTLTFPQNFTDASTTEYGNYSIILLLNNKVVNDLTFKIVSNPLISSFNNFLFGSGLSIMIGLLASIITFVYQHSSQLNQDKLRRSEEKAKWITTNAKYFLNLIEDSGNISALYSPATKINGQERFIPDEPVRLFYLVIKFLDDYNTFRTDLNMYYFDNFVSESFLSKLNDLIVREFLNQKIFDDHTRLARFFGKELYQLQTDYCFQLEFETFLRWLTNPQHTKEVKKLFLNFSIYSWVLYISINKEALVTYSSPSEVMKNISDLINHNINSKDSRIPMDSFRNHLAWLNESFYGNQKNLYFCMFDSKGKLVFDRNSKHSFWGKEVSPLLESINNECNDDEKNDS